MHIWWEWGREGGIPSSRGEAMFQGRELPGVVRHGRMGSWGITVVKQKGKAHQPRSFHASLLCPPLLSKVSPRNMGPAVVSVTQKQRPKGQMGQGTRNPR